MTSPCKQKKKQVSNAGKYVQPNIGNEAQIIRHRTLKYICNQNHRPKEGNDKISHARKNYNYFIGHQVTNNKTFHAGQYAN